MTRIDDVIADLESMSQSANSAHGTLDSLINALKGAAAQVDQIGGRESGRMIAALDAAASACSRAQSDLDDVRSTAASYISSI